MAFAPLSPLLGLDSFGDEFGDPLDQQGSIFGTPNSSFGLPSASNSDSPNTLMPSSTTPATPAWSPLSQQSIAANNAYANSPDTMQFALDSAAGVISSSVAGSSGSSNSSVFLAYVKSLLPGGGSESGYDTTINVVSVLVGLILVAGAIWGFDNIGSGSVKVVVGAAKRAKGLAEVGAV